MDPLTSFLEELTQKRPYKLSLVLSQPGDAFLWHPLCQKYPKDNLQFGFYIVFPPARESLEVVLNPTTTEDCY